MAALSLLCLRLSVRLPFRVACCTLALASCGGGDEPLGVETSQLAYPSSRPAVLQAGLAASEAQFAQPAAEVPMYDAAEFRYRTGADPALEADGPHSDSFARGADGVPLQSPPDEETTTPPPEQPPA